MTSRGESPPVDDAVARQRMINAVVVGRVPAVRETCQAE
jgi:hypothetical protein